MKKGIKYTIWLVLLLLVAYNSVYFKKLSEVKAANKEFDAPAYAQNFWMAKLPAATAKAPDADVLLAQLNTQPDRAFKTSGHTLAIGSTAYFLIKGQGKITQVGADDVKLVTPKNNSMQIATEYVFGNAVRDASGLVNLKDFSNTADLNNISAALNQIIRKQVLPPFKAKVKKGDNITFTGAITLNQAHLNLDDIEIIPISITIQP